MSGDWRDYRPAIWTAMIGIAVVVIVSPHYLGAFLLGGAIGLALRIRQRQARLREAQARGRAGAGSSSRGRSGPGKRRSR